MWDLTQPGMGLILEVIAGWTQTVCAIVSWWHVRHQMVSIENRAW